MPRWLIVAGLVGLSGCALLDPPPPAAYAASGWHTLAGAPLSIAEVEALQQSCAPRQVTLALDPDRPVANPIVDNPVYHPGGEGLANAPVLGIAAPERPVEPGTRRVAEFTYGSPDECLARKGLVRVR
jgi:hypothetical protein